MAINRVLSSEDGNLGKTTLITTRDRQYLDIDLSFAKRPSGDIYKKKDAGAVKQAVKNLLLTNYYEKPFRPYYGGDLRALLFELADEDIELDTVERIKQAMSSYEPRAEIVHIDVTAQPDIHDVSISVTFKVVNTQEEVSFTTNLTRLR
jgi:phage baseplate assembly protein W|tara:strand:+ start:515 stop:961 length:447 start_codon:yes stop_codon:yes gene_type:complete